MLTMFPIKESHYRVAYSSVNVDKFHPSDKERQVLIRELKTKYPILESINADRPIILFAGAYERKGLRPLLEQLSSDQQLIILGSGETNLLKERVQNRKGVFPIPFTNEIEVFFQTCDCFVFPTFFEPFGLVVLEAFATGINLFVTKEKVGASELIGNHKGVQFIDPTEMSNSLQSIKVLNKEDRQKQGLERAEILKLNSWKSSAEIWQKFITS